jgi:hypothetical protein
MRKNFFLFAIALVATFAAKAEWWDKPTICKPNNTTCYSAAGAGFDNEAWDNLGNCKGKKIICPNAIIGVNTPNGPEAFSKNEISDPTKISGDFDVSALDQAGECFGIRKTRNNGTEAKIASRWVNVYCSGALDDPDETMPNGEIMLAEADQPTCKTLRDSGYIGTLNGACYGKPQYPASDFYLECEGDNLKPEKIAILNGADNYRTDSASNPAASPYPTNEEQAAATFDKMVENAEKQREKHAAENESES